jgi:hypothetical protein
MIRVVHTRWSQRRSSNGRVLDVGSCDRYNQLNLLALQSKKEQSRVKEACNDRFAD